MDSKCRLDFLEIEEEMYSIAQLKQDSHSTNSKWHRSFKVDVPYPLDSPRFARNTRGGRATKRFGVIKAIDPSRWLILLVATIRGIVFSLRKDRHDNRNIQEAAIVAASGVFFAPPPPFTTCRYSLRSPRLFSIQSHRVRRASRIAPRCSTSSLFKRLPFSSLSLSLFFLSFSRLVAAILHVVSFEYLSKMCNMNFSLRIFPTFLSFPFFPPAPLTHIRRDTELKRRFSAFHCSVHFFRYRGYWCLSKMIR